MKYKIRCIGKYRFNSNILKNNEEESQLHNDTVNATKKVIDSLLGGSLFNIQSPFTMEIGLFLNNPKIKHWNKRN